MVYTKEQNITEIKILAKNNKAVSTTMQCGACYHSTIDLYRNGDGEEVWRTCLHCGTQYMIVGNKIIYKRDDLDLLMTLLKSEWKDHVPR